jgi:hypothetical protein
VILDHSRAHRSCNAYIPATTISMMDGVVIMIHDFGKKTLSVLMKI